MCVWMQQVYPDCGHQGPASVQKCPAFNLTCKGARARVWYEEAALPGSCPACRLRDAAVVAHQLAEQSAAAARLIAAQAVHAELVRRWIELASSWVAFHAAEQRNWAEAELLFVGRVLDWHTQRGIHIDLSVLTWQEILDLPVATEDEQSVLLPLPQWAQNQTQTPDQPPSHKRSREEDDEDDDEAMADGNSDGRAPAPKHARLDLHGRAAPLVVDGSSTRNAGGGGSGLATSSSALAPVAWAPQPATTLSSRARSSSPAASARAHSPHPRLWGSLHRTASPANLAVSAPGSPALALSAPGSPAPGSPPPAYGASPPPPAYSDDGSYTDEEGGEFFMCNGCRELLEEIGL